ncbi:heme-binding protein [Mucilaginibacter lutimaris]|uniref:Heme-binding protein n=1 Tax=Mucilaginibacter lutimaris TaxID=931629 RepID=A0ABW2ZKM6_9SPHI
MSEQLKRFGMGAQFVPADTLGESELGPLKQLVGEWESVVINTATGGTTPSGWNVISVPGPGGFIFEVIPYKENLKFSTVAVSAGNRGPVINGNQFDQQIFGLFYEQQIISVCDTDFCNTRGFGNGQVIHAETGLILFVTNFNGGFNIARLGTIPHGNAVLALGRSIDVQSPGTNFFQNISAECVHLDGSPITALGYNDKIIGVPQFPEFAQSDPNSFLKTTLDGIVGSGSITDMTVLDMSTKHPDATGGILNIPFIQTNVTATSMDAIFWIENITGGSETELLQYSQTINLVFPAAGTVEPIIWPHITVSTLKRMPQIVTQSAVKFSAEVSAESTTETPGVPQL